MGITFCLFIMTELMFPVSRMLSGQHTVRKTANSNAPAQAGILHFQGRPNYIAGARGDTGRVCFQSEKIDLNELRPSML